MMPLEPLLCHSAPHLQAWFPLEGDQWANQMEYNLSLGDWITNVSYFCLVSICAPVWEEVGEGLAPVPVCAPVWEQVGKVAQLFPGSSTLASTLITPHAST